MGPDRGVLSVETPSTAPGARRSGRSSASRASALLEPARVLVVDDCRYLRRAASRALARAGHIVVEVAGGAEALSLLASECFDLVVLDLNMPGVSGFELLAELERVRPRPGAIVLSGDDAPGLGGRLRRLGAQGLLTKPWREEDLAALVSFALERRRPRA